MSRFRQIALGLFFLTALSVLAFYTLFLTDFHLFGQPDQLVARFPEAHGLREGDPVLVSGMRLGRVKSIKYDQEAAADQRIEVTVNLNEPLAVREGYRVVIEETTLLGGRDVYIDPGPAGAKVLDLASIGPLTGSVEPNPMDALKQAGAVFGENREKFGKIVSNLAELSDDVKAGKGPVGKLFNDDDLARALSSGVNDFAATMKETRQIMADMQAGKGVVGSLLNDDKLYGTLKNAAENLERISADLRAGKGLLGRALYEESLGDELSRAARNLGALTDDLQAGKGLFGKLLKDEKIGNDVASIADGIAAGRGTLGKLAMSSELHDKLMAITEDVRGVFGAVKDKQGSLGELIMNKDLYEEVLAMVRLLNRSLEDYREAAPISTFTSVFFSAF